MANVGDGNTAAHHALPAFVAMPTRATYLGRRPRRRVDGGLTGFDLCTRRVSGRAIATRPADVGIRCR